MTLSGIPADLLARGCEVARKTCRFPSEIVPAIIAEIEQPWNWRKAAAIKSEPERQRRIEAPADCVTADQIAGLIKSIRSDG